MEFGTVNSSEIRIAEAALKAINQRFGGEDGIVNELSEVDAGLARVLIEHTSAQKFILEGMAVQGRVNDGFFRNDIVDKLHSEMRNFEGPVVELWMRQFYYYAYSRNGNQLPSFLKVSESSDSAEPLGLSSISFKYLYMFVNHNGYSLPVMVEGSALAGFRNPRIDIDGYVDSILAVTETGVEGMINGNKWERIPSEIMEKSAADHVFTADSRLPGLPIKPEFPSIFVSSMEEDRAAGYSFYASTDFYYDLYSQYAVPSAFGTKNDFQIRLGGMILNFVHSGEVQLAEMDNPSGSSGTRFYYQGSMAEIKRAADLKRKLMALHMGLGDVKRVFSSGSIEDVGILASHSIWSGLSEKKKSRVVFPTLAIIRGSAESLMAAARHESLKGIILLRGLMKRDDFSGFFRKMKKGESAAAILFLVSERLNHGAVTINPGATTADFAASIINSLFDMEGLKNRLDALKPRIREACLRHLISAIEHLMLHMNTETERKFFEDRLVDISRLFSPEVKKTPLFD